MCILMLRESLNLSPRTINFLTILFSFLKIEEENDI